MEIALIFRGRDSDGRLCPRSRYHPTDILTWVYRHSGIRLYERRCISYRGMDISFLFSLVPLHLHSHSEVISDQDAHDKCYRRMCEYSGQYHRDTTVFIRRVSMGDTVITGTPPRAHLSLDGEIHTSEIDRSHESDDPHLCHDRVCCDIRTLPSHDRYVHAFYRTRMSI